MNYAIVGAFVVALGAVLITGVLWLASGGALQKKYDLYLAIEEESVSGLNLNAPVKYNGVEVGKVRVIKLDPANPEHVWLILAIERGTPIKVDTVAVLKTQGLVVGIENHGDWMADELVDILHQISSPHLGACIDFGNSLALLEDPVEVAQKLSPYVVTSLLKDMMVSPTEDGFLLTDVPLGQGIIPLAKIMEILRKGRSDIHFCLEMVTRDPWKVPYKSDKYWATYQERNEDRMDNFKSAILNKASAASLPKISGMSSARMLAVEDENVRKCVSYAKRTLGL